MLVMVCGYRRSGKDFTCRALMRGDSLTQYWNIYRHRRVGEDRVTSHLRPQVPVVRQAFADALKREVISTLGVSLEQLEELKDQPLPPVVRESFPNMRVYGQVPTYRDVLIEVGLQGRRKDHNYWVKMVAGNYREDLLNVVTDLRFPSELELSSLVGTQALTVRVVNRNVAVPGPEEIVEHHLDDYATDVILTNYELSELPSSTYGNAGWMDVLGDYVVVGE